VIKSNQVTGEEMGTKF